MMQLSVDLALAIERIGTRQHLNDVHFTVQLVRQALRARPSRIDLESHRHAFVITRDGRPFGPGEADALRILFSPERDTAAVDTALAALEQEHGIALLGAALGPGLEVYSDESFAVRGGRFERLSTQRAGCRIVIHRKRKSKRREQHELRFYCRHARVPVFFGKRCLNPRPDVPPPDDALAAHAFSGGTVEGWMAVPREGDISTSRYFENGIYYGVRRAVHRTRIPTDAWLDHRAEQYDPNFRRAVRRSHRAVVDQTPALLAQLDPARLDDAGKKRTTALLLRAIDRLPASAHDLPFLSAQDGTTLSLAAVHDLSHRYALLPFIPEGATVAIKGPWPRLAPERARPVADAVGSRPAAIRHAPLPPAAPPAPTVTDDAVHDLCDRVHRELQRRLEVTDTGPSRYDTTTNTLQVARTHPDLARAAAAAPGRIKEAWALLRLCAPPG